MKVCFSPANKERRILENLIVCTSFHDDVSRSTQVTGGKNQRVTYKSCWISSRAAPNACTCTSSSETDISASSFHHLDMPLAVAEALSPNNTKTKCILHSVNIDLTVTP